MQGVLLANNAQKLFVFVFVRIFVFVFVSMFVYVKCLCRFFVCVRLYLIHVCCVSGCLFAFVIVKCVTVLFQQHWWRDNPGLRHLLNSKCLLSHYFPTSLIWFSKYLLFSISQYLFEVFPSFTFQYFLVSLSSILSLFLRRNLNKRHLFLFLVVFKD